MRTYVSEWTRVLHRNGYLAGVYVHQDSGLRDLAGSGSRVSAVVLGAALYHGAFTLQEALAVVAGEQT